MWGAVEGCCVDIVVVVRQAWVLRKAVSPEHLAGLPSGADKVATALRLGPTEGAGLVPRADGLHLGQLVAPPHSLGVVSFSVGPDDRHIIPHSAGIHGGCV